MLVSGSNVWKFFLGKHGEMYQMHYKIFEVQVVGISKNNLQRFEILESNTHIRPTLRFKFLSKTNQKEILCCAT